ncbi:MAG: SDR family NAD(P)-dependent oxidoreductase, partial [Chthoniobacterales bacterium]|nr:SDR family NAD(P)-dependent oxidoreductase [Chthoniobacterales bacterium]
AAAGIAGTIKAALCLHHGKAPPNLHFHEPNPALELDRGNLRVVTQIENLDRSQGRIIAGVNSFGFGGANAHAILASSEQGNDIRPAREGDRPRLLVISAKSSDALNELAARHRDNLLAGKSPLDDVCLTAGLTQSSLPHRLAICATGAEMDEKLAAAAEGVCPPGASRGRAAEHPQEPVFVFCGQGSQWTGMGCELLREEPVFRDKLHEIDRLIRTNVGWSLLGELARDDAHSRLNDTEIAQPAIFAIQMALVALWAEWGIRPSAVVGHSVGEAAASCVAGVLSLEEATRVICHRAKSMAVCRGRGTMISVASPLAELQALVSGRAGRVAIGAINSPRSAVLSGKVEDIALLEQELTGRGVPLRKVRVEYAFHSALMDPARGPLEKALAHIHTRPPEIPLFSTVTAGESKAGDWDADYWWRNIRQPVLFSATIAKMLELGYHTFLEVGPHPVLGGSLLECLHTAKAGADTRVFSSLKRQKPERETMLSSLGALVVSGQAADWEKIHPHARRTRLPAYPWKLESSWTELPSSRSSRLAGAAHPLLGHPTPDSEGVWTKKVDIPEHPYLADHAVNTQPIFPASAYLEIVLAAAQCQQDDLPLCAANIDFVKALALGHQGPPVKLRMTLDLAGRGFEIRSSTSEDTAPWVLHARGQLAGNSGIIPPPPVNLEELRTRLANTCAGEELRDNLRRRGLQLGPAFTGHVSAAWCDGEALGHVRLPEPLNDESGKFLFHPAFLDACFGTLLCAFPGWQDTSSKRLFLPVTFDLVRFHGRPGNEVWAHAKLTSADSHLLAGDLCVMDDSGRCLIEIKGFRARAVSTTDSGNLLENSLYEEQWIKGETLPPAGTLENRKILILADRNGFGNDVARSLSSCGASVSTALLPDAGIDQGIAGAVGKASFDTVVHCTNLDGDTPDDHQGRLPHCYSLIALFRALSAQDGGATRKVVVVTRRSRRVHEDETADPVQAAACGVVRTAHLELPRITGKLVDIDSTGAPSLTAVVSEIAADDPETETAWRDGIRHVPRLRRVHPGQLRGFRQTPHRAMQVRLRQPGPGVELRPSPPHPALKPDEVLLRVEAAGVNFRDTMKALGIYPVSSDLDLILGDECAGTVLETGADVHHVAVGDPVMAVTPGCFATEVIARSACVVRRPDNITSAQAATMPVVFLTALYALREVGRIKTGDKVLIHSAAGGVGLAGVQIAKLLGAEVFATAGSEDKRRMLADLGIKHVMDSRTLAFRDRIMEATSGRGVDLVLNSLAGEFLVQSVACLAPGGRFLEIGKRDIYENSNLGLGAFRANQSFSAIDMAQILQHDAETTRRLLKEIAELARTGKLQPLPLRTRPMDEAGDALRELAQGKHVGKLVLEAPAPAPDGQPTTNPPFPPDAAYMVTGGVRGFGLATADWLVANGARHLALVGRSGNISPGTRKVLDRWKAAGVNARIFPADLSNRDEVARLFREVGAALPPLRGIIHAATRYESATLPNVDEKNITTSMGPKSLGAWHLHTASAGIPLDFLVLYSSVAGVLGNPGQAAYAAANSFLSGLAAMRRAEGLPATVIHWGVVSDAGHVAEHAEIGSLLESRGLAGMTASESTEALGDLMAAGAEDAILARIRWTGEQGGLGLGVDVPRLGELMGVSSAATSSGSGGSAREAILTLPSAERLPAMTADLVGQLAEVLRLPAASIEPGALLQELGLDSLIAIETVIRIERRLGVSLPQGSIAANTTVGDLAAKLLHLISTTQPGLPAADTTSPVAADNAAPANTTHPAATGDPGEMDKHFGPEIQKETVGAGFYLEWLALRSAEKFLLGHSVESARTRLAQLMPICRTVLRSDWQWALKNLRLVFGDNLNDRQRRSLAALAMENHLASYMDSAFSHELEFSFDNYAELLELAGDRGVILCAVHLGTWEPLLRWAPDIGLRLAAVYRRARNPLAERVFQERRSRYGIEWISSDDTRAITQAVEDRKIVAFMTDLNSYETKIHADFLGVPASCAPGPYALSVLKGAPIVPAVGIRQSPGKVSATFARALWPDTGRPVQAEIARLAADLNAVFTPWILEYAEQYNWLHPRWRCRPDGSLWTLQTPEGVIARERTAPCPAVPRRVLDLLPS